MEDIINRKKSFSRERGWDSHWERLGRQWDFSNKELLQANKKITNPVSKKKSHKEHEQAKNGGGNTIGQ